FSALIICALFILSAWILWPRDKEKETQTENKTQAQVDPSNKPETITPVVEKTQPVELSSTNKSSRPLKRSSVEKKPQRELENIPLTGNLFVTCLPWAQVLVNGDSLDTTPLKHAIELPAGKHVVVLRNPNYETVQRTVEIKAGETFDLNIKMQPAFGHLMLQALPWAHIYIDDKYYETTPLQNELVIPAGRHVFRLENPGFPAIHDTLIIESGRAYEKRYEFR
ncbi:MAG: PEGA domain-containing protein, partial [Calditrichaeota bacterium]